MFHINKVLSIPDNPNQSTDIIILNEVEKYIRSTYNVTTKLFSVNSKELNSKKIINPRSGHRYFHIYNAYTQRDK